MKVFKGSISIALSAEHAKEIEANLYKEKIFTPLERSDGALVADVRISK